MPRNTPLENLPYPCLSEPFARQPIQDLAEAADNMLFRMKSDIDLIDKRPRGRMRQTTSATYPLIAAYAPILTNIVEYDNRCGASSLAPPDGPWFWPELPGLYYGELEFGVNSDAAITKINLVMEVGNFSTTGGTVSTKLGRSFNQDQGQFGLTMRMTGLIHYDNLEFQIQARVRHRGAPNMLSNHSIFTIQYLSGCLDQLVPNPYFEKDASGWTAVGAGVTAARVTTQAFRGDASLQVTSTSSLQPAVEVSAANRFPVVAGLRYNGAASLRHNGSGQESYTARMIWFDSVGSQITTSARTYTGIDPNTWFHMGVSRLAPAGAVSATLQIQRTTNTSPVSTFWIDDATVWSGC